MCSLIDVGSRIECHASRINRFENLKTNSTVITQPTSSTKSNAKIALPSTSAKQLVIGQEFPAGPTSFTNRT